MRIVMKVDVSFTVDELQYHGKNDKIGVVIDVLRATTTVVTAFKNGCASFTPITSLEKAREVAKSYEEGEVLLGGAKKGVRPEGFDLGNAPDDYSTELVKGKNIIFTSSNGTKAMYGLQNTKEVLIASFLNISAVCKEIASLDTDTLIACSGDFGLFSLGDTVCAGMIIHKLGEMRAAVLERSDTASVAETLYKIHQDDIRNMLLNSEWGQYLIGIGQGKDIDTCAQIDICTVVPRFRDGVIYLKRQD
jgi:2-phosphosulfolactate phosphatase